MSQVPGSRPDVFSCELKISHTEIYSYFLVTSVHPIVFLIFHITDQADYENLLVLPSHLQMLEYLCAKEQIYSQYHYHKFHLRRNEGKIGVIRGSSLDK